MTHTMSHLLRYINFYAELNHFFCCTFFVWYLSVTFFRDNVWNLFWTLCYSFDRQVICFSNWNDVKNICVLFVNIPTREMSLTFTGCLFYIFSALRFGNKRNLANSFFNTNFNKCKFHIMQFIIISCSKSFAWFACSKAFCWLQLEVTHNWWHSWWLQILLAEPTWKLSFSIM